MFSSAINLRRIQVEPHKVFQWLGDQFFYTFLDISTINTRIGKIQKGTGDEGEKMHVLHEQQHQMMVTATSPTCREKNI